MTAAPARETWLRELTAALRPTLAELLVISLFINLLALGVPIFVMQVYDRVVFQGGMSTLIGLVVGMALVVAFDLALRQARARMLRAVAVRIDVGLGRRLFAKITRLPLAVLEQRSSADWQTLFRDVDTVRNTLSGASLLMLCDLPFAAVFIAVIAVIAAPIAWLFLLILPAFLIIAWRSAAVQTRTSAAERDALLARDRLVAEMIAGRAVVKALALDRALRPAWEERHAETIERSATRGAHVDGYSSLTTTLTSLTTVAMTAAGALAVLDHRLSIGALIAANMLSGRLLGPLNQLVANWRGYATFRQSLRRLAAVLDQPYDRSPSAVPLPCPRGQLTCEAVGFAYASGAPPVLSGVSHVFTAPGLHALIGPNGGGKTTLLKLLLGLHAPQTGRILLDDADIAQFSSHELARWIGYVPQETALFAGSIRDNLTLRHAEADDAAIVRAATRAGLHAAIVDLPHGYATDIGEAGRRLSAGQRQRLAIARAMIGDPPILLLDEPSSNLDRPAELALGRALLELGRDHAVLVVSHSRALLSVCQTITVLDRGRLAATGEAGQLLPRLFGGERGPSPGEAAPLTPAAEAWARARQAHG